MGNKSWATGEMNPPALRAMVIGFGNLLLKDEGVGVHLARYLEREGLPPGVEVQEGGTSALDLFLGLEAEGKWEEVRRLVILDALDPQAGGHLFSGGLSPGQALVLERKDLEGTRSGAGVLSLHDLDLAFALTFLPRQVEVTIVAIVPQDPYSWGMGLTPELDSALPSLAQLCRKLLLNP
ncbi:MAG: hydrogenase maturation protease [Clostridia bacterium]|nr:hydrogenase maturation protease [Clostridia bacterium]